MTSDQIEDKDAFIRDHWEMLPERLREMLVMAGFEQGKRNGSN